MHSIVAIAGIPGSGKTTLAQELKSHYDATLITTGDIARRVDPGNVAVGGLADEETFREAFYEALGEAMHAGPRPIILDGFPRTRQQLSYIEGTVDYDLIALTCRPDIARDRLLRRGRYDDVQDIIERRITEQSALLEVNQRTGWLYQSAGWQRTLNTSMRSATDVLLGVVRYLEGVKREVGSD